MVVKIVLFHIWESLATPVGIKMKKFDDKVNCKRRPIITKRNIPIAELVPLKKKHTSVFGCMKGSVTFHGDITKPIDETWDADC